MIKNGDTFYELTVVKRVENHISRNGTQFSKYLCECSCGALTEVLGTSLSSGHTKSCGHLQKKYKVSDDTMMNKTFGKLTVISRAPSHKLPSGSVYDMWYCECECGNKTVSFGKLLRTRKNMSCGCTRSLKQSEAGFYPKAELWTIDFLKEHLIKYESQKTFCDLKGVNGGLLSYDFYLPERNILLELHGLQHYQPIDWFGGKVTFEKQQQHDMLKREYAAENGFKLIEIPTNHITNRNLMSLLSQHLL